MRKWIGALCILMLMQLAAASPQEQTTKASIEGIVTRVDSDQPIADAQVQIARWPTAATDAVAQAAGVIPVGGGGGVVLTVPPPPAQGGGLLNVNAPPVQIAPLTTDSNGKFLFKDLEPGTYRLMVTATGFVQQEYGQRSLGTGFASGTPIVLTTGHSFKNAAIRLTPTGTVSGRIFDNTGQPAIGIPVTVIHNGYDQTGLKTLRQIATGNANDRGEYRVFGISPGRYYLVVGNGPGPLQAGPRGATGQPASVSYALSYFPGVNDIAQASLIDIKPGGEAIADMTAVRQKMYSVRGRVVDQTGQMVANAGLQQGQSPVSVSLTYTRFNGGGSFSSGRSYDPATGKFELLNVIPGAYVVQAQMQNTAALPITSAADIQSRQAEQASRPLAELPIVVQNADLENLVLTFTSSASVPGKLNVEGQQVSDLPGYDRIRIQFRKFSNGSPSNIGSPPQQQPIGADGSFQVVGLRVSEYLVSILGVPPTFYLKSLQYDGKDVLGKPWEFAGTSGSGFNIVLGSKPGQVSGTVTDAKLQPISAVQAVLIPSGPDGKRERADLYKFSGTDSKGNFSIAGIAPGNYKVFAWDGLEPYRYFDADFMKIHEAKGKAIVVGESATVTTSIQVIPLTAE